MNMLGFSPEKDYIRQIRPLSGLGLLAGVPPLNRHHEARK
jgi:hypothetical protein